MFAYDVLKDCGLQAFKLQAVLLWTIHNFRGYGIAIGVACQGYEPCPVCGPHFRVEHSMELGKQTTRILGDGYHMITHEPSI